MSFKDSKYAHRLYHYSIRKTTLGIGSVIVGLFLSGMLAQPVYADVSEENISVVENREDTSPEAIEKEETSGSKMNLDEKENINVSERASSDTTHEINVARMEHSSAQEESRADSTDSRKQDEVVSNSVQTQFSSPEEWHKVNHYTETDKVVNFDNGWKFNMGNLTGASDKSFDDSSWQELDLPHDFSLSQDYTVAGEAESGYKPGGIGWYRKNFTVSEEAASGHIELQFDGAYMETEVFLNGQSLGVHPNGYSPFSFDLTKHIKKDEENTLAIKVTNNVPSSRWYSGSGIYRSVHLNFTPSVHIEEYGVIAKTPDLKETQEQGNPATIQVTTHIANQGDSSADITVKTLLFERAALGGLGKKVAEAVSSLVAIQAEEKSSITTNLSLANPKLWSVDSPNLYILRTEVYKGDEKIQSRDQETGFRYIEFDKDSGFKLNGQSLKLQGVCMHHDQGSLGAKAYYDAIERQFDILKNMGVNAVRVTHNPASRHMKDIANRKGIMLIDEAFDTWEYPKNGNSNDYSRWFHQTIGPTAENLVGAKDGQQQWSEFHVKQMVKSGINDPAIIMWSTGNEVLEGIAGNPRNYPQVISNLIKWIGEVDDTRPATLGDNKLKGNDSRSIGMAEALHTNQGIVGYNYANGNQYDAGHANHPEWMIYGSETASSVNSRSIYNIKTLSEKDRRTDKQLSSYDQSTVGWGHLASQAWYDVIVRDFVAGEFVWTGFDYLGEPTPWNGVGSGSVGRWPAPKSSYFGIVDTAGFPKDSYYFYRSQWNKNDTTLHILPAWEESLVKKNFKDEVEVVVYSNAAKVQLVHIAQDGTETDLGSKEFTRERTASGFEYQIYKGEDKQYTEHKNLYLTWNVAYRPGTLKAIAYNDKGEVIPETVGNNEVKTFGEAKSLVATAAKKPKEVTDKSLAYIEVDVKDESGNLVVNASNPIHVQVDGPAELVAMDNGNAADHQSYRDSNRHAFGGKALAILKMTGKSGKVTVTTTSEGLAPSTVEFDVTQAEEDKASVVTDYKLAKTIYIKRGSRPILPKTTRIRYQDSREEDKELHFDDKQIEAGVASGESFVARGAIQDLGNKAEILVAIVDKVAAIKNISAATEVGNVVVLPETVQAYQADGSLLSSQFPVEWQLPEKSAFDSEGTVTINGIANVLGDELPVTASVRVARKTITIDANVAPAVVRLSQNIPENLQTDTLSSIIDGNTRPSANEEGGTNPTIWSNYNSAQEGHKTATLRFSYDTAQNLSEVVAYYHKDNWSLRLPKSTSFTWSATEDGTPENIHATEVGRETVNSVTKITYRLEHPVPAVVFNMTVENSDEDLGNRKTSVGLVELELKTALEQFVSHNDASLTEIRIGDKRLSGSQLSSMILAQEGSPVTASNANHNVGITILPEKDGVVKIFTESEDKSHTGVYTIQFVTEYPRTEDRHYIPREEITVSAGSTEPGSANAEANVNDFDIDSIWHSEWGGTTEDKLWLTLDTGKDRQLNGLAYLQRRDESYNGKIGYYEILVSSDNEHWQSVGQGAFEDINDWQEVAFAEVTARYIRLVGLWTFSDNGKNFMSASEVRVSEVLPSIPEPETPTPETPVQPVDDESSSTLPEEGATTPASPVSPTEPETPAPSVDDTSSPIPPEAGAATPASPVSPTEAATPVPPVDDISSPIPPEAGTPIPKAPVPPTESEVPKPLPMNPATGATKPTHSSHKPNGANNSTRDEMIWLYHEGTTIKVFGRASALNGATHLRITAVNPKETVLQGQDSDVYDISLYNDKGEKVAIKGEVTVAIPSRGKVDKVYYVLNQMTESLPFIQNETLSDVLFKVTHFSQYALVYVKEDSQVIQATEKRTSSMMEERIDDATKSEHLLPKTGDTSSATTIAGLSLSVLGISTFMKRKRDEE